MECCRACIERGLHVAFVNAIRKYIPFGTISIGDKSERNFVFVHLLMVYIRIKLHMDLQADESPVVVKGPFFPRVVNPRYRIRGTMCNARIQSSKATKAIF
jgi:hypothetical protein